MVPFCDLTPGMPRPTRHDALPEDSHPPGRESSLELAGYVLYVVVDHAWQVHPDLAASLPIICFSLLAGELPRDRR